MMSQAVEGGGKKTTIAEQRDDALTTTDHIKMLEYLQHENPLVRAGVAANPGLTIEALVYLNDNEKNPFVLQALERNVARIKIQEMIKGSQQKFNRALLRAVGITDPKYEV